MRDVARAAGVSPRTVSNVVNGYVHVAADTRAVVQEHVRRLGYRPHAAGRQLRRGRSGVVTLAVPGIAMPYFADLAGHLVAAARARGLTVVVEQTDGDLDRERAVAAGMPVRLADALVFSPLRLPSDELEALARHDTPVVLIGEHAADTPARVDRVAIDSVAVARLATTHLIDVGRRRIAMIGAKRSGCDEVVRQRTQGYRAALRAAGLTPQARLIRAAAWERAAGAAATTALLAEHADVDAVFAANDAIAVGVLAALARHGRRVPDDVAVIGVDDVPEAAYCTPGLSTVALDRVHIAVSALELVTSRLADPERAPQVVTTDHRLVVRGSTVG